MWVSWSKFHRLQLSRNLRDSPGYSGLRFRSKNAYSVMIFMLPDLHCKYAKYSV